MILWQRRQQHGRIARLCGAVAQLGERRVRNAEVGSSILLGSTNFPSFLPLKKHSTSLVFVGLQSTPTSIPQ